jgi:aspartyl-tRNA(Asn)/glutamyl-tRNA(Gln) amidotransferase subunit B
MLHHMYEAVIGLEVHCQLQTESKAFSPEVAAFGAEPNINVDPVSLGHPGTLPVLNDRVVEFAVRLGLAMNCNIAPRSELARKHYFYPDLPKGYQISQYDTPICYGGEVRLEASDDEDSRAIGITRIHIEEDAGKSLHDQDPSATFLDFNRVGTPLVEIVTEPDVRSARDAALFLEKIRQLVRYLGICDGNMEQGSLRCDANVSIRKVGQARLGTKTEVKNMNSFRHVERALEYEIARQIRLVESGERIVQETRLWDANAMETRSMRSKEEAHDYRYFPDPDLVPIVVDQVRLSEISRSLPELPEKRRTRFVEELGLPAYDAGVLTEERDVADYFEDVLKAVHLGGEESSLSGDAKATSNMVMTDVLRALKQRQDGVGDFPVEPSRLAEIIALRKDDEINSSAATQLFETMLEREGSARELAAELNLILVRDDDALRPIIETVISENQKQVDQYRGGKTSVIGFFIGQVMRRFDGSPDPNRVREMLQKELDA